MKRNIYIKIVNPWPKPYPIGPGLLHLHGTRFSVNMGTAKENVVAIELLRRSSVEIETEIFYWKDAQQREVDFVVKKGTDVASLILVCYDTGDHETGERERMSLLRAGNVLNCKELVVITWDEEGSKQVNDKEILFIPLWKWLLDDDYFPIFEISSNFRM